MSTNETRMNMQNGNPDNYLHRCSTGCFSWTAIIIGALVGTGLGFLLNLLGSALGLAAFSPSREGLLILAASGFIGMVVGVMIVTFISGWIAGFIGSVKCECRSLGILYGFSAWSLTLIVSILLASSAAQFVSSEYEIFTNPGASAHKLTASKVANTISNSDVRNSTSPAAKATVNDEKAANMLGKSLLLLFVLFLVGAITSGYGGFVGMRSGIRCKACASKVK
jgi:MFS family permease